MLTHCLEIKQDSVEKKYKDAAEDVEKWKKGDTVISKGWLNEKSFDMDSCIAVAPCRK